MATYMIAFRLNMNATYSDRRDSVVRAIRAEANGSTTWEEMTSLIVLRSNKSADELARSIYVSSLFDGTSDALLVVNMDNNTHATRGEIIDPLTLGTFFSTEANGFLNALLG
ncbi:hypothetical protein [Tropicimonas isoalkanivorans]|uniref:Uncharacterized protein n=1 Tax=Tropicimonas isoalkanivorans TaxID=441112 RepID=A0A1I1QBJ9_9RHOB|nr:hypothetical protein [Tropicimonas isoalkanivorans]SFD19332.1 hypothetical protein SAMN04488094_11952 [Tropicimonas isoalkanivorans]